jgi:4-amino-4-deoxy-L-arabinose transferase-like glycosyltransferase
MQVIGNQLDIVSNRRNLALAVGILLLAAMMRLWQIASLPPGMDNDEAFHMLRAEEILRGEALPIYITGNNGNEPLYAYTAAIGLALVGSTAWAGRLMAAWVGLLGVAITIRLGAEMFRRRSVGLLAGLVMATLLWHVNFSRFGSQPILAATAAAGTMAALWRGAHTGSRRYYVLAGLCLGLGLDAYVAFRLFPPAVLVAGLALLITRPAQRRSVFLGCLCALCAALIVYAPLAWFFIQNPQWFFNRFGQTTEGMLNAPSLVTNAFKTLGGLFWEGDSDWRFNLPGRPALDIAQALFFALGIIVLLRRWRQPESWTLLVWLVVGLAPSVMTLPSPHFGRTTMVTPAIVILVALGIATAWQIVHLHLPRAIIAVSVVVSSLLPAWLYFGVWANDPRASQSYDAQQYEIAHQLKAAPEGAALYATPMHVGWLHDYWTIEYLLGRSAGQRYSPFNGTLCTVAPAYAPAGARIAVVAAPEADDWRTPAILPELFPNIKRSIVFVTGDRFPMTVYDIPAGTHAQIPLAPLAEFGNLARLLRYQYSPQTIAAGEPLRLDVLWEALQPTDMPYKLFVHLLGAPKADGSVVYAQYDGEPCARLWHTTNWRPGELLSDTYSLRVPADLPPGGYKLEIGWYAEATGIRVPQNNTNATSFKMAEFSLR